MADSNDAAGRRPVNHFAMLPTLMLCVLGVTPFYAGHSFLSGTSWAPPTSGFHLVKEIKDAQGYSTLTRSASQQRSQKSRPGHFEWVRAVALGCVLAASAARFCHANNGLLLSKPSLRSRRSREFTVCHAGDEDEGQSIFANINPEDEPAGDVSLDGVQFDEDLNLTDEDMDDGDVPEEEDEDKTSSMMRQQTYTLGPSRQYVMYIAKKNAIKTWTKDGRSGPGTNWGCYEVQIAVATEKIRNMVLHIREFPHDLRCKNRLISLVSRRRWMLDKLSWRDVDAYINIRDSLKIRHVYRMEALIGRLPAYKFTQENRKRAPGRKTAMRLKKTKRLLNKRLATQLRQGKPADVIFRTKQKINSRSWSSRAYDEAECIITNRPTPHLLDPLDLP